MEQRKSIIPHKPIFYHQSSSSTKTQQTTTTFLLKYFPKYLHKIQFNSSKVNFNRKLKHLKIIHHFDWKDTKKPHKNFWRLVIANKRKTIQTFVDTELRRFPAKFKNNILQNIQTIPKLQSLNIIPQDKEIMSQYYWHDQLFQIERIYCYLNSLKNLKNLTVNVGTDELLSLLPKLNSSKTLLSRLQSFRVLSQWPNSQDYQGFQVLLQYKNILKNLTYLSLGILVNKGFFEVLQALPEYCHRISSLLLSISQKEFAYQDFEPNFDQNSCVKDLGSLECLADFKTLINLRLSIFQGLAFLRNIKFPSSLQKLKFYLLDCDWEKDDINFDFERISAGLANLKYLSVDISLRDFAFGSKNKKSLNASKAFCEGLLRNISGLNELVLTFSTWVFGKGSPEKAVPFDFAHFLQEIRHFSHSLKVLEIQDYLYQFTALAPQSFQFSNLIRLDISSRISPDIEFENIFAFAPSKAKIKLQKIFVRSFESLLSVFRKLCNIKDLPSKDLEIVMEAEDVEADDMYLEKKYEELINQVQKESLKNVVLRIVCDERIKWNLPIFEPLFGKLTIDHCLRPW